MELVTQVVCETITDGIETRTTPQAMLLSEHAISVIITQFHSMWPIIFAARNTWFSPRWSRGSTDMGHQFSIHHYKEDIQ